MFGSGLGIPRAFYHKYATFLSHQGYHILTFDYRGIGDSQENRGNTTTNLKDLGEFDMVAVAHFLRQKYPSLPLHFFTHSVGGQVFGLMQNHEIFDQVVFISTVSAYIWDYDLLVSLPTAYLFYLHIPIVTRIWGELPKGMTYRGISIAKGIAQDWARYGRDKRYIGCDFGKKIKQHYYPDIKRKIHTIHFTDDPFAKPKSIERMMQYYKNADIQYHKIVPADFNLKKIGHSGFFSSKVGEQLWRYPLDLIENEKLDE